MFILMDKPRAASWFELGTILEIQPAYGFDLGLPPPQILNPLSPSSPFLSPQATIACIFISWESCYPSYLSPYDYSLIFCVLTPSLTPLQTPDDWS